MKLSQLVLTGLTLLAACSAPPPPPPPPDATVPGAPTAVSATSSDASATVSWTAPGTDGGSALLRYRVTASPGGASQTVNAPATSVLFSGLTNGTSYTFTVVAINAVGEGAASASSTAVTPISSVVPGQPTGVTASPGNAQATVVWAAPADSGGSPIVSYTVTANPGALTATVNVPSTSTVFTGLSNGTAYTFSVIATNAAGAGLPSEPSAPTTPAAGLTVPSAPTGVTASSADATATVSWNVPSSNGGSGILSYTVTSTSGGGLSATVLAPTTTVTFTGLTNGTSYSFRVVATNGVGNSALSSSAATTPATQPGAPTSVVGARGNGFVNVSWTAPASNGGSGITSYVVTASPGGATNTVSGSTLTALISPLTNGTAYTFTVVATNAKGSSAPSAASAPVTPATLPGQPTGISLVSGPAQVTVSWTPPASNGGEPITEYVITRSPSVTMSVPATETSAVVTGLTNGTSYTFWVQAKTVVGLSAYSTSANATPRDVPGAPTIGTATASAGAATVTWTAPASNGGSAITGYTVTSIPDGITSIAGAAATSRVISGLTNGTTYTFTVMAMNAIGNSLPSAETNAVTPKTIPDSPTGVVAVPGNASATVSWTPSFNGGSPVTSFVVLASPGGATATVAGTVSSANVTGLTNGAPYTFTVRAINVVGSSPASSASTAVTPSTTPDAPTAVLATNGNTESRVSWTPGFNGGSAVISYTVTQLPSGPMQTVFHPRTNTTFTGLTNTGSYSFSVVAHNMNGDSPEAVSNTAIPERKALRFPQAQVARSASNASAATFGDFDEDGNVDIVQLIGTGPLTINVFRGDGQGGFLARTNGGSTTHNGGMVAGDLDGDGHLDLAMSSAGGNSVMVHWGNGDGAFVSTPAIPLGTNASPQGLAIGDLNGDGRQDLAVALSGLNVARVLFSQPGRTFTSSADFATGAGPQVLVSGLFNADAFPDLAVANMTDSTVTVLANDGAGVFTAAGPASATVAVPFRMITGDLNVDGKADLVASGSAFNLVSVMLGNGDGSFQPKTDLNINTSPGPLRIGELNGNSFPDLVVGMGAQSAVGVLLGNGDGTFQTLKAVAAESAVGAVFVADVDKDGNADLPFATGNGQKVGALINSGSGSFQSRDGAALNAIPERNLATADFNSDGRADVVVGTGYQSTSVQVVLAKSDGTLNTATSYSVIGGLPASTVLNPVAADFNGDGKADIAVAVGDKHLVATLRNNGNGTFATKVDSVVGATATPSPVSLAAGDFNGDGKADLVCGNGNENNLSVLIASSTGTFPTHVEYALGVYPSRILVGRIDGDAHLDLLVTTWSAATMALFRGNGDGTFQTKTDIALPTVPGASVLGDLNGDGKQDLLMSGNFGSSGAVYFGLGNGDGTFGTFNSKSAGQNAAGVALGDFDGDGRVDLAVANTESNFVGSVMVFRAKADGTYFDGVDFSTDHYPAGLVTADFDNDGRLDFATTLASNSRVMVLRNRSVP